jgi:predicted flap endonuclease-1-like 5' DNA nuclease
MNLFSFCDIPWWLTWLLPALLGLALGWALWSKYKSQVASLESTVNGLNGNISSLQSDLATTRSHAADLDGEVAIARGRMREAEDAMHNLEKNIASIQSGASSSGSADAAELHGKINALQNEVTTWKEKAGSAHATANAASFAASGSLAKSQKWQERAANEAASATASSFAAHSNASAASTKPSVATTSASSNDAAVHEEISALKQEVTIWKEKAATAHATATAATFAAHSNVKASNSGASTASSQNASTSGSNNDTSNWSKETTDTAATSNVGSLQDASIDTASYDLSAAGKTTTSSTLPDVSSTASQAKTSSSDPFSNIDSTNLQIIEGIGPKMQEILNENGIINLADLSKSSPDHLRSILDTYGDKYKIVDCSSWVAEANLAASGQWSSLIAAQKADGSDSKLEKYMTSHGFIKTFAQDDLKIVEGIGPKIDTLLHGAGINSWRALANTSVEKLKSILQEGGPQFQLADPGTWPKQAELAADGKMAELKEYQDFLIAGKG